MSKQKKYEMARINSNPELHIIRALVDIPKYGVKKGDYGGFIESEKNLSQDGEGWIEKGSFVKGRSYVTNGYVSGSSSLLADVELKNGRVDGSELEGWILIDGDILIEKSEVYSTSTFSGEGVIKDSVIVNGCFYGKFNAVDTRIEAEDECSFGGNTTCDNATIDVHSAYIPNDCTLKHVRIRTAHMESNQDFTFEYIDVDNETNVIIGEDAGQSNGRSIMCGTDAEKVVVRGEGFKLHNSKITGSPTITGTVVVKNSTISGMPTIEMRYGKITNSTIDECAIIKSTSMYVKEIKGKRIDSDTLYDFDKK